VSVFYDFVGIIGFAALIVSLIALVRGRLRWAQIPNRQSALAALVVSVALFAVGLVHATGLATRSPMPATPQLSSAAPAGASSPTEVAAQATEPSPNQLICFATMSDLSPADYSITAVIVQTGKPSAKVTTMAHYQTGITTHTGISGMDGNASIDYQIADAPSGVPVRVDVTVSDGVTTQSCITGFTPA
jgi:hypothetical protein